MENGEVSIQKTCKAYQETFNIVLKHVETLVNSLTGKSVVSSDHGELLGERIVPFAPPKFGHSHQYIENETLYRVPCLEIPGEIRRDVMSEDPVTFDSGEIDTIEDRLHSLGYQ